MLELSYGFWFDQGFRKIGKLWEFANDDFVRNQKHLIKNIRRGKTVYSRSSQNAHGQGVAAPVAETDRQTLNANIQNLKHDTEQMFLELKRKEEVKKMHEITSQYLKGRLETLERNHQSVLSSVGQKLEKPENEFSIWLLTKTTERKRKGRIRRNNPFCNAASIEDHVGTSHVIHKENDPSVSRLSLNMENLNLLESSMTFWEKITDDVGAEVQPKSLEVDMNSMPLVVVPDPVATEPDGVVIPNHVATEPAVIDASDLVAVEPTDAVVPEFVEPKEQPVTSSVTTGYNNEFWGQYLQEESENEDIPSRVGQYWRTKRV